MPGVGSSEPAGRKIQNAHPYRDKHLCIVVVTDRIVRLAEDLCRGISHHGNALDNDLAGHHEQCSRHPLAGYISDYQSQMIVINQEVVVGVTSS